MASRLNLQTFLEKILESRNVYFQPPESVKMKYPAIVYALDDIENVHADNGVYSSHRHYSVTLLTLTRIVSLSVRWFLYLPADLNDIMQARI